MQNVSNKEYKEGFDAWDKHFESNFKTDFVNPYAKDSEDWRNWNRGWNGNFKGVK